MENNAVLKKTKPTVLPNSSGLDRAAPTWCSSDAFWEQKYKSNIIKQLI